MITNIYKKIQKTINHKITLYVGLFLLTTGQARAQGLVPCEGADDCNFEKIVTLANNVANFIFFRLPIILLVIFFAWNGIMLIINRDKSSQMKEAKKNLLNVLLGYLLIVGAYVIVKTFITLLAGQDLKFKVFFN